MGRRGLTGADEQQRPAAGFWSRQVDAAALVGEDEVRGGGGGARALERQRRKTMEGKSDEDLWAGPIYKGRLVNGRGKRGGEDMIILPQKRLDFRDGL